MAASQHIRRSFTWERTVDAVERRLRVLGGERRNWPRMNTDAHGWESVKQRPRADGDGELARNGSPISPSDPNSIRVHPCSSVAQNLPRPRARTSLTMIVRDEQHNLPNCLSSVAGLFDEIVVVDTGSTDRTREIALEFGARVFDFVWVDDFAAARNAALARATGDYAFWLDADDVRRPATTSTAPGAARGIAAGRRCRLRGPLFVRSRTERRWRADGRGSHPAVPGP